MSSPSPKRKVKTFPIPIRFDPDTIQRMDRAAKRLSSHRAGVVRLALIQLLPQIEAGQITLTPETPSKQTNS